MRNVFLAFMITLTMCCVCTNTYAKTYYVGQESSGNGSGDTYTNKMSVKNHNSKYFSAGDVIYICDKIQSSIIPKSNGTSANPIYYRGDYKGHTAIINLYHKAFYFNGRGYITLTNINDKAEIDGGLTGHNIDSGLPSLSSIYIYNSNHIVIDNWKLRRGWTGVKAQDSSDITITRCYIEEMARDGLKFINTQNIKVGGSKANRNEIYRTSKRTMGGALYVAADIFFMKCKNAIVSYNEMHGTDDKLDYWGMTGIKAEGLHYAVIEYNSIHDHGARNYRAGIHLKGENSYIDKHNRDIIVRYNKIYDLPTDDSFVYVGAPAIGTTRNTYRVWIYGNRIDNCEAGISIFNNGEAEVNDGSDGVNVESFYVWANVVSNVDGTGISIKNGYWGNEDDFNDIFIINNSVHKAGKQYLSSGSFKTDFKIAGGAMGNDDTGTPPFIRVKNNIFSESGYSRDNSYTMIIKDDTNYDYIQFGNNLIYSSTNKDSYRIQLAKKSIAYSDASISCWLAKEKIGDPRFLAESNGNFALKSGSAAAGAGEKMLFTIPSLSMPFYSSKMIKFSFNEILHANTNWSTHPPSIVIGYQDADGQTEVGAYVSESAAVSSTSQVKNVRTVQ